MLITLSIGLIIMSTSFLVTFLMLWHFHKIPFPWVTVIVQPIAILMQMHFIGREIRRKSMRKDLCDVCGGELVNNPKKNLEDTLSSLFSTVSVFRIKPVFKITQFTLQLPFGASHKDMDMCSRCMDDFKEFIQRKKSYQSGEKR